MTRYDPELVEAAPWLAAIERAGAEATSDILTGLDPSFAVAIAAGVPVVLRVLRILNEYTSAVIEDRQHDRELERERKRMELDMERRRMERDTR